MTSHSSAPAGASPANALTALVDLAPFGAALLDAHGIIRYANAAAGAILGVDTVMVLGARLLDIPWRTLGADGSELRREDHPALVALRTGEPQQERLVSFRRPDDGRAIWLAVGAHRVIGAWGTSVLATFRDVTRERDETTALDLVRELAKEIGASDDVESALRVSLERICDTLHWDYGEAWLPTLGGRALGRSDAWYARGVREASGRASSDDPAAFGALAFSIASADLRFARGECVAGAAWAAGETLLFDDVTTDPTFSRRELAAAAGFGRAAAIPVIASGEVAAVLVVFRRRRAAHAVDERTVRFDRDRDRRAVAVLETVANQIGALIDRRLHVRARQESDARFRAVSDGGFDSVIFLETVRAEDGSVIDFDIVDCNAGAEAHVRQPRAAFVGKRLGEVFPSSRDTGLFSHYVRVADTRQRFETEFKVTDERLGADWLRLQAVPLGGDGIAIVTRDVSAERRVDEEREARERAEAGELHFRRVAEAEAARLAAEERFRAVHNASPDGFFLLDVECDAHGRMHDGRVSYANAAAALTLGIPTPSIVGRLLTELEGVAVPASIARRIRRAFDGARGDEFVVRQRGPARWTRVSLVRVGDAIAITTDDITATREAELVLRRSRSELERLVAERTSALAEKSEFLSAVVGSSGDGIVAFDRTLTYTAWNPAMERHTGKPTSEVLGKHALDLFPSMRTNTRGAAHLAALRGEAVVLHAVAFRRGADGSEGWTDETYSPLRNEAGEVVGGLVLVRDVSERRRAEEAQRESERRFREILGNVQSIAVVLDANGDITYCNDALLELSGWTRDEVMGRSWFGLFVPENANATRQFREGIASGEMIEHYENAILTVTGEQRLVSWDNTLLRDPSGKVIGTASLGRDITEQRQEQAERERLTVIIDAMPDAIAIATADGRVPYLNRAAQAMLGMGDQSRAGRLGALAPEHMRDAERGEPMRRAVREGMWSGERSIRAVDGETPVMQTILAHRGSSGAVEYFSTILRDVSERKKAEAELLALSVTDVLTSLHNRRGFLALAEERLRISQSSGRETLLFYLDLDGFKQVNDTQGHAEGDRVLALVAEAMRATFAPDDVLGRLGGDEFVALVSIDETRWSTEANAVALASGASCGSLGAEILARLRERVAASHAGAPYRVGVSAGIASRDPRQSVPLEVLLAEADRELYAVKRAR